MQINNIFAKTSIITSQNKLNTKIQKNIVSKNKIKVNTEMKRINEILNKPSKSHVLSTVSSIDDLYQPIEDYFKSLSTTTKTYETYSNLSQKLQNNTLSDDDVKSLQDLGFIKSNTNINTLSDDDKKSLEKTLQTGENFEKVLIMDFTSSNAISDMDKYINNIKPSVNKLFESLNAETNVNINSIAVDSVEQFGLKASNNMNFDQLFSVNNKDVNTMQLSSDINANNSENSYKSFESNGITLNTEVFSNALKLSDNINFDQVLDGIKNAENNFYKNVVTKLDDINSKYGDVNNSDFVKKIDANAYEIDTYA
ncbi:hypothetical protein [Clostridium akagii]|uniref:hypothetical protein n=1 Tax=Clostridium akagii TaxID=91623 RepID=UPI00047C3496|nr:hypothetical protein [Clostridium akagii]